MKITSPYANLIHGTVVIFAGLGLLLTAMFNTSLGGAIIVPVAIVITLLGVRAIANRNNK